MTPTPPAQAPATALAVAPSPAPLGDGRRDFDFLHGTWRIHNARRRHRLAGSTEWDTFEGRAVERPLLDGQGNLEEYAATLPDGTPVRAVALRLYEPATQRWTIRWANAATGTLDAPMAGAFRDGVGEFYGHEDYEGRMVLVRFRWTHDGPDAARWEQAYSADGGATWETNWVMTFTRTGGVDAGARPGASDDGASGAAPPAEGRGARARR